MGFYLILEGGGFKFLRRETRLVLIRLNVQHLGLARAQRSMPQQTL
eukprot:SAG11_NODE_17981_length_503_cov_1.009901_2_plen_46_part_00